MKFYVAGAAGGQMPKVGDIAPFVSLKVVLRHRRRPNLEESSWLPLPLDRVSLSQWIWVSLSRWERAGVRYKPVTSFTE